MHERNQVNVKFKFSAKYVNACRRKVQKMDGRTKSQTYTELWHSNLILKTKSYVKFQLNMSKHIRDKLRKLYFQYSTFQKGHNSHKN